MSVFEALKSKRQYEKKFGMEGIASPPQTKSVSWFKKLFGAKEPHETEEWPNLGSAFVFVTHQMSGLKWGHYILMYNVMEWNGWGYVNKGRGDRNRTTREVQRITGEKEVRMFPSFLAHPSDPENFWL